MKELFKKFIKTDLISVKYAKGVSDMKGKEFHAYNEIIYFMGGSGTFISDNMHIELKPDLIMVIPKESYHQMSITGNEEDYHRLVIHFDDIPKLSSLISKKMTHVFAAEANAYVKYLFDKLFIIIENNIADPSNEVVVFSVLTLLLEEISDNAKLGQVFENSDTLSYRCIDWIDKNIGGRISVSQIAQELNMSPSNVAHVFKAEMNISIYQYILKKRLMSAHKKILAGQLPTQVALECGFNDYSGFYKQYKKMFNDSPSSFKNKNIEL